MPRVRFTIRWMLVVVAIAACIIGGLIEVRRRRDRFEAISHEHWLKAVQLEANEPIPGESNAQEKARREAKLTWHDQMTAKYEEAAQHPWLPVKPDPPEPM